MTNVDPANGIHYGVISVDEVCQSWCDESTPINEGEDEFDEFAEPTAFVYMKKGYQAKQTADDTDIFITKSPYYTLCQLCSPCAPGAGYIMSRGAVKAYCFGHDWFEDGKAPYPIYQVSDDSLIEVEYEQI